MLPARPIKNPGPGGDRTGQAWDDYFALVDAALRVLLAAGFDPVKVANFADDTAAAAGGVALGGVYRTGSALKVRVA